MYKCSACTSVKLNFKKCSLKNASLLLSCTDTKPGFAVTSTVLYTPARGVNTQ